MSTEEAAANAPSLDADRQFINRIKKKYRPVLPKEPENLADIDFPEWLTHTMGKELVDGEEELGDLFLLHDSGSDDPNRFFMFATSDNVKQLENHHLFADGTFRIAPDLFLQVYTIHALVKGKCLPLVFCLLPRKTGIIYTKMLKVLKDQMDSERDPLSITSDFEGPFIKACAEIFPKVAVYGCFFHFKQSMFRHVGFEGLAGLYSNDIDVKRALKIIQYLAYVPCSDVVKLFGQLKSERVAHPDELTESRIFNFYKYVEVNYIGKTTHIPGKRGPKGYRATTTYTPPQFSIALWNINQRHLEGLPRTNNFSESWHNAFSAVLDSHPSVYKLITELRKEQKRTENLLAKINTGMTFKQDTSKEERVNAIMLDYSIDTYADIYERLSQIV